MLTPDEFAAAIACPGYGGGKYAPPEESLGAGGRAERRARVWWLREAAAEIRPWDPKKNQASRISQCGRVATCGAKEDSYFGRRSNGDVSVYGTQSCTRHWECASCRLRMAAHHATEIGTALTYARETNKHVRFATFTARHERSDSLSDLISGAKEAWGRMTSGRAWHGWRSEYGIEYVMALEITRTEQNGWHVHFHAVLISDNPSDLGESHAWLHDAWCNGVGSKMGPKHVGSLKYAVDLQDADTGDEAIGRYLVKLGLELSGDLAKDRRDVHSGRTPWQILKEARDAREAGDEKRARYFTALWLDYLDATYRRRWMHWTQRIRLECAMADEIRDNSEEALAEIEARGKVEIVGRIPHEIRRQILKHPWLQRACCDAYEISIPIEHILATQLSAVELAYWEAANEPDKMAEFSARITAQRDEFRAKRKAKEAEKRIKVSERLNRIYDRAIAKAFGPA